VNHCKQGNGVGCGENFGSVAAFDAHRVGVHEYTYSEGLQMNPPREDGRRCLSASEIENRKLADPLAGADRPEFARNKYGSWSLASGLEAARTLGVPILGWRVGLDQR
jgi:hypothetical protein